MAENTPKPQGEEALSDAKKLANEHLADPNHIITEEDMAKIRVGQTGEPDAPTREAIREAEDRASDSKSVSDDDDLPAEARIEQTLDGHEERVEIEAADSSEPHA